MRRRSENENIYSCDSCVCRSFYYYIFLLYFSRAGKPFWKALIPGYNWYVLYDISIGQGSFWGLIVMWAIAIIGGLLCTKFDNLILQGVTGVSAFVGVMGLYSTPIFYLAKAFGYSDKFSIFTTTFPFIGLPIVAFGTNEYKGPKTKNG